MNIAKQNFSLLISIASIILLGSGCNTGGIFSQPTTTPTESPISTATPLPTFTPTQTFTPTPTFTPTLTPTPTWVYQQGTVTCPVLLYHRIEFSEIHSRYYVAPEDFEIQMKALYDWGYTTIPISLLAEAVVNGTSLPPRPIVITFDDGNMSVYNNAFPAMQKYGFTGVVYIVGNFLEAKDYMHAGELQGLAVAGWEIGSHSMSHAHLPESHDQLQTEIRQSKLDLEAALGIPVNTFAYPFGEIDEYIVTKTVNYGYVAAVGLGSSWQHDRNSLYYLSRIEIENSYDMQKFASVLPWSGSTAP